MAGVDNIDATAQIFERAANDIAGFVSRGTDKAVAIDQLVQMATAYGLFRTFEQGDIEGIIGDAIGRASRLHLVSSAGEPATNGKAAWAKPLAWIDLAAWDGQEVPPRQWAIADRVPLNNAGLFSGEGGAGKSIIELMKDVAHVTGKDWLGSMPEQGPAIYVGAEDDEAELHRRLHSIAEHYDVTFKQLADGGLHVLCLLGQDATLCAAKAKSGKVEVTALYRQLFEAAGDIKPKNISIDTLSRAFQGNEIDRTQVYQLAMHMQALAMVANASVTILSHPSLQGIATGTGISGSTAWHGAFRFRQYLTGVKRGNGEGEEADPDLRYLEFKKNQYGPTADAIALKYQRGLFLPVPGAGSLEQAAKDAEVEYLFLKLLRRFADQGRNVTDKRGTTYAPAMFAEHPDAANARISNKALSAAMARLFAQDRISIVVDGPPSRQRSRIVEGKSTAPVNPICYPA